MRQVEVEHDQAGPGHRRSCRPAEELHGLLAIARYMQADGRARLLERLCDHCDIPRSSSVSRTSPAYLPVPVLHVRPFSASTDGHLLGITVTSR